ncbi:MAG: large-conductance mechanosensitive channel protein MscL [Bacteroidales bacterium]|nr:large-conductance mechanosensitive channel protein MscL [Bacteroidales bacterium]
MAKSSFWADFKAFAMKGNVIDMAVGVVVGGAFGKIVTSLVNDIIMPFVGWLIGGINFTDFKAPLKGSIIGATGDAEPVYICYGNFIQQIIDFAIVAFCIFLVIRLMTKASAALSKKKEEEAAAAPEAPAPKPDDVVLLEEIRDLLKNQK